MPSCFLLRQRNICTELWIRRCQRDSRSTWKSNSSLEFSLRLVGASQSAQRIIGFTMQWLDAYGSNKGTKEAQLHVKQFSSCKYTSHCHIPQSIATLMDN